MSNTFDLIIIGAGPGGYPAALKAAKYGLKTAVIEKEYLGGTCLNKGCIPAKTLLHAADLLRESREGAKCGVVSQDVRLDAAALNSHQEAVIKRLREGVALLLRNSRIELFSGVGKVLAPGRVQVTTAEGAITLEAPKIIVACGSQPVIPDIPGAALTGVLVSDDLLQVQSPLPASLLIVGGGVIGVEFATAYSAFGSEITIMVTRDRLLADLDADISANLANICKKRGIKVITGATVRSIEQADGGLLVNYEGKKGQESLKTAQLLFAKGRQAACRGIFADDMAIAYQNGAIVVDEHFMTSVPGIYAIGDCTAGSLQLAHAATAQGGYLIDHLCGKDAATDLNSIPSCIYCDPEIACVGLSAAEAEAKGIAVTVGKAFMTANGKALLTDQERSFIKIVCRQDDRKIIGAQLFCARATDMIGELAVAISQGLTVEQMASVVRAHPTYYEAISDVLATM